jgi:acyl carrier protein
MDEHARIEEVFRAVLGDGSIELADETRAADLPGWDSLAHINAMFALENEFGVEFPGDEFARIETIGELKAALAAKGAV